MVVIYVQVSSLSVWGWRFLEQIVLFTHNLDMYYIFDGSTYSFPKVFEASGINSSMWLQILKYIYTGDLSALNSTALVQSVQVLEITLISNHAAATHSGNYVALCHWQELHCSTASKNYFL